MGSVTRGNGYHNCVFVFGSNLKGIHGAGAARFAVEFMGARRHHGSGWYGNSYALPTKRTPYEILSIVDIEEHIENFFRVAENNPDTLFQVTRVGCGLAGYNDADMAPLFREAPMNCILPGNWMEHLYPEHGKARVIVAGSRNYQDESAIFDELDFKLKRLIDTVGVEIVSGTAKGADSIGTDWAIENGIDVVEYPAEWDVFGKRAGIYRNLEMAWYATHLIAFWNGKSRGTKHMIESAEDAGLQVSVINV
ncbi:SLOG family protein [Acidithiobacillus sp. M4-SHS-6]|uniref:A1S_2505 family phage non-structural protein n=1 Tax=Acidithiobacillus sp. M4-SHS-6 TaxID=3383024 RepID=UPI0039BE6E73